MNRLDENPEAGFARRSGTTVALAAAAGLLVAAPSASASDVDLFDHARLLGVDLKVSGTASISNDFVSYGYTQTNQELGLLADITFTIGDGGYFSIGGYNFGFETEAHALIYFYGGYRLGLDLEQFGETGLGLTLGYNYYAGQREPQTFTPGGPESPGNSVLWSYLDIVLVGDYTDPFIGSSFELEIGFSYYHNGQRFSLLPGESDRAVAAFGNPLPESDPYWAIFIQLAWSYTIPQWDPVSVGWSVGGYPAPYGAPHLSEYEYSFGGLSLSYYIGKGLSLALDVYWNSIPVDFDPLGATGSGGNWIVTLTQNF